MNITDTFILMASDDPKKKLLAEYYQAVIRYSELMNTNDEFPLKETLLVIMNMYISALKERCTSLGIKPTAVEDFERVNRVAVSQDDMKHETPDSSTDACPASNLCDRVDRMIQLLESINNRLAMQPYTVSDFFQKPYFEPLYSPYRVTCGTTDGFKVTTTNGYKVTCDTNNGVKYTCSPSLNEEDYRQKE